MVLSKKCFRCGNEFHNHSCQTIGSKNWVNRKFCSIDCANKTTHSKEKIKYICRNCGVIFYSYPSIKRIYCSNKCKAIDFRERFSGNKNPSWKELGFGYHTIHNRIIKKYGRADHCEINVFHKSKKYEWSNLDHKYTLNRNDWKMMCNLCHKNYDATFLKLKKPMLQQLQPR